MLGWIISHSDVDTGGLEWWAGGEGMETPASGLPAQPCRPLRVAVMPAPLRLH